MSQVHPNKTAPNKRIVLSLPVETHAAIAKLADNLGVARQDVIRIILKEHIDQEAARNASEKLRQVR